MKCRLRQVLDVINAAGTVIVPNKLEYWPACGREGVARPAFAFNDVVIDLRAVIPDSRAEREYVLFRLLPFCEVHDDVEQHRNIIIFERVRLSRRQ